MNTPPPQGRFGDPAEPTPATCVVLRLTSDEDMRLLVTSGIVWRGGPKTIRRAIEWAVAHPDVPLDRAPERVAAYVAAARSRLS